MTPRQTRLVGKALGFCLAFVFIPPFAFIGDRPSRVHGDTNEDCFDVAAQWISAIFHAFLPLFVMATFGVWGFALIPLSVLVVARRLSARKGTKYYWADLLINILKLLEAPRVRNIVLYGTGAALLLQLTTLFGLPLSYLAAVASAVVCGTWLFLAFKAAGMNIAVVAAKAKHVIMLSKATSTPVADWDESQINDEGLRLAVISPPMGAVLHFAQIDSILALIAPQWQMNQAESDNKLLVLDAASDETIQRRLEEAQSGGLIAGNLSEANAPSVAAPAYAGVAITDDDLT